MRSLIKKVLREADVPSVENPNYLISKIKNNVVDDLGRVYLDVTGDKLVLPPIDIKIDDTIKDGKIAGFNHPKNGENGKMGIKSKALEDVEYLKWVITHELIHAAVGKDLPKSEEHEGLFKKLAEKIGLPKEYWD
tara:strand:- start:134 stop:538 length:405 start_codon:yes stop_codon:yes gene_type:complete